MTTNLRPIKRPPQVKCVFRTHSKNTKKPTFRSNSSSTLTLVSPVKGYDDMEAQFAWDDKTIRQTFIRKVRLPRRQRTPALLATLTDCMFLLPQVYAILLTQLLVTVGIVALFSFW